MPRFAFDLTGPLALLRLVGASQLTGHVDVEHGVLDVRFGLLRVRTPLRNVAAAEVTGPYSPLKSLGVRLSLADAGLTLGTSTGPGLCLRFERPVATSGLVAIPLLRHPGLTVTVEDPEQVRDVVLRERDRLRAEEDALLERQEAEYPPPSTEPVPVADLAPVPMVDDRDAEPDPDVPTPVATPPRTTRKRAVAKGAAAKGAAAKGAPAKRVPAKKPSPAVRRRTRTS